MDEAGLIVIGSGPGGVSAADAYRQHDRDVSVRIFTADPEPPYARPPLSKDFLRGGDTDDVWLHPAQWYAERSIDLRLATEVVAIDPTAHTVTTGGGTYAYTSLVLACGAAPTPLPVPGFWSTIGDATLKYHAWGDGYDHDRLLERGDGFTVWYELDGAAVGVLTHDADDEYDAGEALIAQGRPAPVPMT